MSDTRDFDYDKDLGAIKRIWREVGWIEGDQEEAHVDGFFSVGHTRVGVIDSVPECSVHTVPGHIQLNRTPLSLCAVTAVTTSRIARGKAFAKRLTAQQLIRAQQQGAQAAALGMFDQGFYDLLGFGTGAYDYQFTFDPSLLMVDHRVAPPVRLGLDNAEEMHAALLARHKVHGSVDLAPWQLVRAEMGFHGDCVALGYRDDQGVLTHFLVMDAKGERGPYRVFMWAYQNNDQLLQLLGLIKSLADQVYSVVLLEPPELQLQALLERPFRHRTLTRGSDHGNLAGAAAWWQVRVLDVVAAVAALGSTHAEANFSVQISDPLDAYAEEPVCGGRYVVQLGEHCHAERVSSDDDQQADLTCSINAFSRWVFGVCPASSLRITDEFTLTEELAATLDNLVRLPRPTPGWDF